MTTTLCFLTVVEVFLSGSVGGAFLSARGGGVPPAEVPATKEASKSGSIYCL